MDPDFKEEASEIYRICKSFYGPQAIAQIQEILKKIAQTQPEKQ